MYMSAKEETIRRIRKFSSDRDWAQYHTPANLAKSIAIEAGELLECYQWGEEADLDLVCISPNPDNPVCRVMDYNKFLFEKGKREKEAKKKQKETELKEVGLKLTTDVHDVEVKRKMVVKFLSAGDRVKVNIRFRGREMAFQNKGFEVLDTFAQSVTEYGSVDRPPKLEGRNMVMYLSPAKKK